MEKLNGHTKNITDDNIAQLKQLFPDIFREGKIDFDHLSEILGHYVNDAEDHYNFTWHGKRQAGRLAQTPSTGTLRPAVAESSNFDTTKNIFIEGDNLEVLKLLQKSYHRKIKMIYIDPPYNTGNDFVYTDNFADNLKNYLEQTGQTDEDGKKTTTNSDTSGRYHTNWLNMIYPRLKLARNLLRDDGVIFISIDDNEQANLKKVCDEVFGEENALINSIWCKGNAQNDADYIQKNHEYILAYKKNDINLKEKKTSIKKVLYEGDKCFYLGSGIVTGGAGGTLKNRLNLGYSIYVNPKNKDFIACDDYDKELAKNSDDESKVYKNNQDLIEKGYTNIIRPPKKGKSLGRWTWNIEKFNNEKETIFITDNNSIYKKIFVEKDKIKNDTIEIVEDSPPNSVISFSSSESSKWLNQELGHKIFDNPKPLSLIKRMLKLSTTPNDIILDFFAGSGTTAHAVMQLNAEDGGNRQFICVQIPEKTFETSEAFKAGYKTIAEISKERIRRAGAKIKQDNPLFTGDTGFKVFKLDTSNLKRWDATFETIETDLINAVDYIKADRSHDDLLYELLIKLGLDLSVPIETRIYGNKKIYIIGLGALIVCLDENISLDTVDYIGKLKAEFTPETSMRVVFRDHSFADDSVKTNTMLILKRYGIDDVKSL